MSCLNHAKKHSLNLSQNLKFKFIFIDSLLAKSLCHVVELNLLLPDKKKKKQIKKNPVELLEFIGVVIGLFLDNSVSGLCFCR